MPDDLGSSDGFTRALLLQLSEQVGDVASKVGAQCGDVLAIKETLARIVPLVDDHERHLNRSAGVRDRGRLIWGGLTTVSAGGIGGLMTFLISRLTAGGPPSH